MSKKRNLNGFKASQASRVLKAISNQRRLVIVCQLLENENMSVGEISKFVPVSQSALSQHLSVLRANNIVKTRRNAQSIIYSLAGPKIKDIVSSIYDLCIAPKLAN